MSRIYDWGKNKPVIPAMFAQIIAITPKLIHGFLVKVRKFDRIRNIPLPKSKIWLSFYLKSKHLQEAIIQNVITNLTDDKIVRHITDFCSEVNQIAIESEDQLAPLIPRRNLKQTNFTLEQKFTDQFLNEEVLNLASKLSFESHPLLTSIYNLNIKFIEDDIEEEKSQEVFSKDDDILFTPEVMFFLKVVFPCWIFYTEHHTFLLRKARQGDVASLEKLLRLDISLTADRLINNQMVESISSDPIKFDLINKAIQSRPKEKNTIIKIKTFLAGIISVLSEELGHRFTAPDIQDLFDAVAIDYGRDELRDPDLPDSPEAFSKAIQRERTFWQNKEA